MNRQFLIQVKLGVVCEEECQHPMLLPLNALRVGRRTARYRLAAYCLPMPVVECMPLLYSWVKVRHLGAALSHRYATTSGHHQNDIGFLYRTAIEIKVNNWEAF